MKNLVIIEEIGDLTVSASIANWSLLDILNKRFNDLDVLTLDNISDKYVHKLNGCNFYLHKKDNLSNIQILISKRFKIIQTIFQILIGNNFEHYNRIKNIRKFLNINNHKYNNIILLSGGMGFTPHQAISRISFKKETKVIGVYHDPYPSSTYPEPYKGGNKYLEYFKKRNLQKTLNKLSLIIFPSQKLHDWYKRDYKIIDTKVFIIPHSVKFNKINKSTNNKKPIVNFKITHTGSLLEPRNPKTFLEVFDGFKKLRANLEFYGPIHKNIYEDIKTFKSDEILIVNKRIPYTSTLDIQRDASFLLLIESGAEFSPFLPTKFVDYINSGKPIIVLSPKKSEVSRLLGVDYPFIATLNDKIRISTIFENIYNPLMIEKALKIINCLKDYFSEDYINTQYSKFLNLK
tara:strand:+ start:5296 stop:6507 length:1212 start_codon:yes stop_codon:yes gene_type:complete